MSALVAASCGLAGLVGCSPGPLPYVDVVTPRPTARPVAEHCPRSAAGLGLGDPDRASTPGTLPVDVVPDRVRQCRVGGEPLRTDEGQLRSTATEETSPVTAALLASLTLPDQELDPRDHAACAAVATSPVYVLLLDRNGHAYRPWLPLDPCHDPRPEVQAALAALTPTTVTTYRLDTSG